MAKNIRSIWKGHITVGLMTIPIKVYSAVDTADVVRFNQLHEDCNGRIGYEKKCKKCSETVENAKIVKGYQYSSDEYAIFDKDEIESIKLKSTKNVEIQGFVKASTLTHYQIDAPYFVGPNGKVSHVGYNLIAQSLMKKKMIGIGKIILRDREDVVALAPVDNGKGLVLFKLRQPGEIRSFSDIPTFDGRKSTKAEVALVGQLIDQMTVDSMDELDLIDRYRDELNKLVNTKIEGREIVIAKEEGASTAPGDIMEVLKASIAKGAA